jgi:uncharacterized protein (TIGR00269 family)
MKYFESKVKNTIARYKLVDKNDHLGVACSGGKDSTTVLYIVNKIFEKRPDIKITALAIDEGINGYRNIYLKHLKEFCNGYKISLKIYSFKNEFGQSLDQILKKNKIKPCSACGVLRRYLLNRKSQELKFTKLVTGHNMDDEVQSVLMNQFRNNVDVSARLGPITGVVKDKKFIPRIKPLYFLTDREVKAYALLKNFVDGFVECPYSRDSYRGDVRDVLNNFEWKYPGSKHSVILSFLEILPLLKSKYKEDSRIKYCERCSEPCSSNECNTCKMIDQLKLKKVKNSKVPYIFV